jgi:hypothetical protein
VTSSNQNLVPLIQDERFHTWGPGIHVATGSSRYLGFPLWNSMAVVELSGKLLVWNPIALTAKLRGSVQELEQGTGRQVAILLAALDYHHKALPDWQRAFPQAETFLVSDRILEQQPTVRGEVIVGDRPIVPGAEADLELLSVRGCLQPRVERSPARRDGPRREWFVFHRPSRSLLVGDMLFLNDRVSPIERLLGMRVGLSRNDAGFRVGDLAERNAFVGDVLGWDFEQALTVHGKASARGGAFVRGELKRVFRV